MPIIVKDFKWRQTERAIVIQVPLHSVHKSKVDTFISRKYIKASYEKYFFEVVLLYNINTLESRCTLTSSEIIFELIKSNDQIWESLEIDADKIKKLELKKQLIEEQHQNIQKHCKEVHNRKCELKRVAVQEQISCDAKQKEHIQNIKDNEKAIALGDLKGWREETPSQLPIASEKGAPKSSRKIALKEKRPKCQITLTKNPVPLPRKMSTLNVDFTERQFPTPSRESKLEEENEWLRKQAEVRRSVGFVSEDLRPEEKNPLYLKAKGEEFLKNNNYLGAISAFSFGIKLSKEFVDLYIGRARAHFALENYCKTIEDCSSALELMKPAVSANLIQRVECISQRGISLCKMGLHKEGVQELEAAIQLQPCNSDLKEKLLLIKDAL